MIAQIPEFLDRETCTRLMDAAAITLRSAPEAATFQWLEPQGQMRVLVDDVAERVIAAIFQRYQRKMVPSLCGISRYLAGRGLARHVDRTPSPSSPWLMGAFCYLNEDFVGGEVVFDEQDLIITPRTGLLALWPGEGYPHAVQIVQSGERYALGYVMHERLPNEN
jgi:2OG-Fe(II) oxygenase superfamily